MRPMNLRSTWRWGILPIILCLGIILMPAVSMAMTAIEYAILSSLITSETLIVNNEDYQLTEGIIYGREYVRGTTGSIFQTDYTNLCSELYLGDEPGSGGTYNLSGGTLWAGNEYIGVKGTGTLIQSGGTNSSNDTGILGIPYETNLYLGYNSGSSGSYELQGGSLSAKHAYIGYLGTGTFTQSGGTHTVNHLFIGVGVLSNGTYNLEGGTLSAGTIQVNPTGSFNISGGTHTVTGNVVNAGTIKTTNAEVIWNGAVTVESGGRFISDPCENVFMEDLTVRGTLEGCKGDVFCFSQDVFLEGEAELAASRIEFLPGGEVAEHRLRLPAECLAINTLYIAEGEKVILENDGTLYVRYLEGLDVDYEEGVIRNLIVSEEATDVRLIYDISDNPELGGQIFSLQGGESNLIPTPVPASVLLLGTGLLGLGLWGRRRRQS